MVLNKPKPTFIKINTAGGRFEEGKNTAKQVKSFIFARIGLMKF